MRQTILYCCFTAAIFLLSQNVLLAQHKAPEIHLFSHVNHSGRVWRQEGYSGSFKDSLNKIDHGINCIAPGLTLIHSVGERLKIQWGLHYTWFGFKRRIYNVQQGDSLHPGLPRISDESTAEKDVFLFYRLRYIYLPLIADYRIGVNKNHRWRKTFLSTGFSFGYLLNDNTIARLYGFKMEGQKRFILDNVYETKRYNLQMHLGARFEYLLKDRLKLQVQPLFNIPLDRSFTGHSRAWIYSGSVNVGLSVPLGKKAVPEQSAPDKEKGLSSHALP